MTDFILPPSVGREILRCEVGSTLHGTGLDGGEDLDLMGVFLERPTTTIGLGHVEQWIRRTAKDGERSTPGDTDLVMYAARKWAKLALNGNPTVLLLLFAPEDKVVSCEEDGQWLRDHADLFASRRAGKAFLGYMVQQRQRMTGERGRAGRIRQIENDEGERQIDWKYAMHMLRLGHQGVEYLTDGRLTLPVPAPLREHLRSVRKGEKTLDQVVVEAWQLEAQVEQLLYDGGSPLPAAPETEKVERWLIDAHLRSWGVLV